MRTTVCALLQRDKGAAGEQTPIRSCPPVPWNVSISYQKFQWKLVWLWGPSARPPSSPDLSPPNTSVRDYFKDCVYAQHTNDIKDLTDETDAKFGQIIPQMLVIFECSVLLVLWTPRRPWKDEMSFS
jgi:hypothetical protein